MRSSKSRSRSKGNRNRSMGNIVNRVFDSSGPEGKVRGTPQQIIDKYNQLARDAQLGNDRVATENFQQHAEHYLRMLAEAQREQQERQQQQQNQQPNTQGGSQQSGGGSDQGGSQGGGNQSGGDQSPAQADSQQQPQPAQKGDDGGAPAPRRSRRKPQEPKADVLGRQDDDHSGESDTGLVETPEERSTRPRRSRAKPQPQPQAETTSPDTEPTQDAAE